MKTKTESALHIANQFHAFMQDADIPSSLSSVGNTFHQHILERTIQTNLNAG
jgi:hypothetical protein